MSHKNILLLSVSAGSGHLRAAEALRCAAASRPDVSATHLDVMDFVGPILRRLYTSGYIGLLNLAPSLWAQVYRITDQARPSGWLHRLWGAINRRSARPLLARIAAERPDAIICTHFLPAALLSHLAAKGGLDCPVWVQVTDFDLHRMWIHPHITGYLAANEEVAFRMRAGGIAERAVHVTAIPVMPAFSEPLERATCAGELGLDPAQTTILLMGGGAGLGSLEQVAQDLLAIGGGFQLIAVAGKNAATLAALQALAARHPGRLVAQGFTKQIERLMACSDLVVTKPGGLTTSECLAMGLPMIVNAPIPGQEERNADYLTEQGVALKAFDPVTLEYRVRLLLRHPEKLAEMRAKAKALGRPDAAQDVLGRVISSITPQPQTGKI